jgi:hypothetical protein
MIVFKLLIFKLRIFELTPANFFGTGSVFGRGMESYVMEMREVMRKHGQHSVLVPFQRHQYPAFTPIDLLS